MTLLLLAGGREPKAQLRVVHREGLLPGVGLQVIPGGFQPVPLVAEGGDLGVFDEETVVRLGAQPGHGPIGAAAQYLGGVAAGIAEDHELVMGEVAVGDDAVVHIDCLRFLQIGTDLEVLIRQPSGGVIDGWLAPILLEGAVGKNQIDSGAQLRKRGQQFGIVQLVQRRVNGAAARRHLVQFGKDLLFQETPQCVAQRIADLASSSGVSTGASSWTGSATQRPAGSSGSPGGMFSPFDMTTRASRGIAAIVARSADVTNCGRFQTRSVGESRQNPARSAGCKAGSQAQGHGRGRLIGRPSELLPYMVTSVIGGQVSAGRVRLHHVERRSPAAACARLSRRQADREVGLGRPEADEGRGDAPDFGTDRPT